MEITPTIVVLGSTVSVLVSFLKWKFKIKEKWKWRLLSLGLGVLMAIVFIRAPFLTIILHGLTIGVWAAGMYNMAVKPVKRGIDNLRPPLSYD